MRLLFTSLFSILLLTTAGTVHAQEFNVDFGDDYALSDSTFGAAAGAPGPW